MHFLLFQANVLALVVVAEHLRDFEKIIQLSERYWIFSIWLFHNQLILQIHQGLKTFFSNGSWSLLYGKLFFEIQPVSKAHLHAVQYTCAVQI